MPALKFAAGAILALSGVAQGFVIELRSEEELADAIDSYPALVVDFHDPSDDASRKFSADFQKASKMLVPQVQLATVDSTSEDFVNVLEAMGNPTLQVYLNQEAVEADKLKTLVSAKDVKRIVEGTRALTEPDKKKKPNKPKRQKGEKPEPKPKPKPKDKAAPKDPKQGATHSDDELLIEPPNSKVTVLTEDTFDSFLEGSPLTLVKFYAPWCGHCKRMAPRFTAASIPLAKDGIALAKIDQTANRPIGSRYDVKGFPTLLIFEGKKKVKEYDGGRTQDEIEAYMRAFKNGESTKTWDPESTEGDPNDPCLTEEYALDNYGPCCGRGNFEKPGHHPICAKVRDEVKARKRAKMKEL